jgi:hypothetical protein
VGKDLKTSVPIVPCLSPAVSEAWNGTERKQLARGHGSGVVAKRRGVKRRRNAGVRRVSAPAVCDRSAGFERNPGAQPGAERSQSAAHPIIYRLCPD